MSTAPPAIVKLGGSVITDKSRDRTLRDKVLARLAGELADAGGPLVVIHGAGSFGHRGAREHRLADGRRDGADARAQLLGAAEVHADVRALHLRVVRALQGAGVPALGFSPVTMAHLSRGELVTVGYDLLRRFLAMGFAPVTHGDVVFDRARDFGVASGDAIAEHLAFALRPRLVVFATDVDGVLRDGAAVPRLSPGEALALPAGGSEHPDVTGGMAGKLRHAAAMAREGVPVRVVNGLEAGRVRGALTGENVTGTLIASSGDD